MVRVNLNQLLKTVRVGSVKRAATGEHIGSVLVIAIDHAPAPVLSSGYQQPPLRTADIGTGSSFGDNPPTTRTESPGERSRSRSGPRGSDRVARLWQPATVYMARSMTAVETLFGYHPGESFSLRRDPARRHCRRGESQRDSVGGDCQSPAFRLDDGWKPGISRWSCDPMRTVAMRRATPAAI